MESELNMTIGSEFKSSGITENTPKTIMLGAGTIHKDLVFGYTLLEAQPEDWETGFANYYAKSTSGGNDTYTKLTAKTDWAANKYYRPGWNFKESLICATSGGSKVSITPEFYDVPVDGALVKVKGLTVKTGETAKMEVNPIELTPAILKMALIGDEKVSDIATGYSEITSRAIINEGDYLMHMAYVGKTIEGNPIIIIFDYALCTSGLELEGKNKEAAVPKFTFECFADLTPEADTLPYHIYYPTPAA